MFRYFSILPDHLKQELLRFLFGGRWSTYRQAHRSILISRNGDDSFSVPSRFTGYRLHVLYSVYRTQLALAASKSGQYIKWAAVGRQILYRNIYLNSIYIFDFSIKFLIFLWKMDPPKKHKNENLFAGQSWTERCMITQYAAHTQR